MVSPGYQTNSNMSLDAFLKPEMRSLKEEYAKKRVLETLPHLYCSRTVTVVDRYSSFAT